MKMQPCARRKQHAQDGEKIEPAVSCRKCPHGKCSDQVPEDIIDSCRLDGAGEWRILFHFVMPLSKAGIATILLYYLVAKWDDWYWPSLLLANSKELSPLALKIREGLNNARGEGQGGGWDPTRVFEQGSSAAMMIIGLIPIMAIYPFLQKYFSQGVMVGAIKS